jgi:hypothetical protein
MKLFRNVVAVSAVNQFILDFQKIAPLRKYSAEIGVDLSEKLRFISLNRALLELGAAYLRLDTMRFVRRANHMSVENLVRILG